MISLRRELRHFFLGYSREEEKEKARIHWFRYYSGSEMPQDFRHPDNLQIPGIRKLPLIFLSLAVIFFVYVPLAIAMEVIDFIHDYKNGQLGPA